MRIMVQTGKIDDPHMYLALWLMCRRLQGDSTTRILPDTGGLLDQDHETMWAFGVIDDAYRHEVDNKASLEKNKVNHEQLRQQLLAKR